MEKILEFDKEIRTLIHELEYPLQGAVILNHGILANYLIDASSMIKFFDFKGTLIKDYCFDVLGTVSSLDSKGDEAVFKLESFAIPYIIYSYKDGHLNSIDQVTLDGSFIIEENWCRSNDGTRIHMFIVRRLDIPINKVLLYGYGGFGIAITPRYYPYVIPFIEDGGVFVVANIRGGNEYGEE